MLHTQPLRSPAETQTFSDKLENFITTHRGTIEFTEIVFADTRFFTDHVSRLTNLRHLNLVNSRSGQQQQQSEQFADLPNLKTIGLKNATHMLRLIKNSRLETLKVIDTGSDRTNRNLNDFLKHQPTLTEVKFMGFIPQLVGVSSFTFKLTVLSVLLKGQPETTTHSILALMRSQKESLRELKLIGFNTWEFVECAVNEMSLVKLEIDLMRVRFELGEMRVNRSIRCLMIQSIALNVDQMVAVIGVCHGVETLRIVSNTNLRFGEWLTKAAVTMVGLRHLSIDSLLSVLPPKGLKFPTLETLTLSKLGSDAQIHGFVQLASRCPNLKRLTVTGFGQQFMQTTTAEGELVDDTTMCRNDFLFLLVALPKLQELELRGKFTMTEEVVEVLMGEWCRLRRFNFSAEMDLELVEKLRRLNGSRVQCKVMRIDDGKRATKRKSSETEDTLRSSD
jgi:hypothetical protein